MRLDIENAGHEVVNIVLPPDTTLHYTVNLWLPYGASCRSVQLIGSNSTLQCNNKANPSGNDGAIGAWAWGLGDHFSPYKYSHDGLGRQPSYGYKFGTISAGSNVLQLTDADDSDNFDVGARVFLHGRNKQDLGYPPNLDYHEYNTVIAVDSLANTITLANPITYDYDDAWHDIAPPHNLSQAFGKPRVVNLDDTTKSFAYDYFKVVGVHYGLSEHAEAPGLTSQYMTTQGAILCDFVDASSDGHLGIGQNKRVTLTNCNPTFTGDVDKLLGTVNFVNVNSASSIEPATGAELMNIDGGSCTSKIRFSSRDFNVNDLTINSGDSYGAILLESACTNESGSIDNITINYDDIDVYFVIQAPTDRRFTPTSTSANHILKSVTQSSADNKLLSLIVGDIISDVDQVNWARVTDVTYDDINERFDITHNNSVAFSGDIVLWPSGSLNIGTITVNHPTKPKYENMLWKQPHLQHQKVGQTVNFTGIADGQVSYRSTFKYVGIVDEITFTLTAAATSSDPNHLYVLSMSDRGDNYFSANNRQVLFSGECQTDGATVTMNFSTGDITFSAGWSNTGDTPADLSAISNVATFLDLDVVKPSSQGGGGLTYTDPLDCPVFDVEINGSAIA